MRVRTAIVALLLCASVASAGMLADWLGALAGRGGGGAVANTEWQLIPGTAFYCRYANAADCGNGIYRNDVTGTDDGRQEVAANRPAYVASPPSLAFNGGSQHYTNSTGGRTPPSNIYTNSAGFTVYGWMCAYTNSPQAMKEMFFCNSISGGIQTHVSMWDDRVHVNQIGTYISIYPSSQCYQWKSFAFVCGTNRVLYINATNVTSYGTAWSSFAGALDNPGWIIGRGPSPDSTSFTGLLSRTGIATNGAVTALMITNWHNATKGFYVP